MGGPFQAQAPHVFVDGFAHHPAEHAMEMKRRKTRQRGKRFEVERVAKVRLNVYEDPENTFLVILLRCGFHDARVPIPFVHDRFTTVDSRISVADPVAAGLTILAVCIRPPPLEGVGDPGRTDD